MDADVKTLLIVRELCEKRVKELAAMGLPSEMIAVEMLAQTAALLLNCPIEPARNTAEQFWRNAIAGIQKECERRGLGADVVQFPS